MFPAHGAQTATSSALACRLKLTARFAQIVFGMTLAGNVVLALLAEGHSQSLQMDPNQPDVLHHWVFLRAKQCAWPIYEAVAGVEPEAMRQSTSALALLSLTDDPDPQFAIVTP